MVTANSNNTFNQHITAMRNNYNITTFNIFEKRIIQQHSSLIKVSDVHLGVKKIAGVRVPLLENVDFEICPYSLFNAPKWYADGIHLLKVLAQTAIEREFIVAKLGLLEHARKKTTQKVNLFEKVQIPGYQDALRKIKRFMEDEENLSKSSQKIMKSHQESRKEAEA